MSLNAHFIARMLVKEKNGKKSVTRFITEECGLWQTPTIITDKIMKSSDKLSTYLEWASSRFSDDNDYITHVLKPHIKSVNDFVKNHEGWIFEWYSM